MLTALILICSLASIPNLAACTQENALALVRDPETFAGPAACFMHAQAYLAQSAIGRDLSEDEIIKVTCVRSGAVTQSSSTDIPNAR
jgi:hypothetical protein